jgi:hypothetical protein
MATFTSVAGSRGFPHIWGCFFLIDLKKAQSTQKKPLNFAAVKGFSRTFMDNRKSPDLLGAFALLLL